MTTFESDPRYLRASLVSAGLAVAGLLSVVAYGSSVLPAAFCGFTAIGFLFLARQPAVRTSDQYLMFGSEQIPWQEILRVDSTRWSSPLVLRLTLRSGRSRKLIYAGSAQDSDLLLRRVRRLAANAFLDGVPHRQYWGLAAPIQARESVIDVARARLFSEQDEAEVERLFQELRSKGRLGRGR